MTSASSLTTSTAVEQAVAAGAPVVALESTIFTHGLPRPRNLEVALHSEEIIREEGAVPATVGVVGGRPVVGLTEEEIHLLAHDDEVAKASIRDLSYAAITHKNAGTTIAATAFLARAAGVDVFATGGVGGVHHGAAQSFDESADMVALSRIPIVLVSSGTKSILDIGATLERFETLSVPVVGYRTWRYPGFYVVDSGYDLTARVESAAEVATMVRAQSSLGIGSAILVANPIPVDSQLDPGELDEVLQRGLAEANEKGIKGQPATPFLLDYIRVATGGRSLDANAALYYNNVRLATEIATELARKV